MSVLGDSGETIDVTICSVRGETFELQVPSSCTIGELRELFIGQLKYSENTAILYRGKVVPDRMLVSRYPCQSLELNPTPDSSIIKELYDCNARNDSCSATDRNTDKPSQNSTIPQTPPLKTTSVASSSPNSDAKRSSNEKTLCDLYRGADALTKQRDGSCGGTDRESHPTSDVKIRDSASGCVPSPLTPKKPTSNKKMMPNPVFSVMKEKEKESAPAEQTPIPRVPSKTSVNSTSSLGQNEEKLEKNTPLPGNRRSSTGSSTPFTIFCNVPDLGTKVTVTVNSGFSVKDLIEDLIKLSPQLKGPVKVLRNGKIYSETDRLFDIGIRNTCSVYIASGNFNDVEKVKLVEVEEQLQEIEKSVGTQSEAENRRTYEVLMQLLFSVDSLQTLEDNWKARRKEAVKRITALQDQIQASI